MSAVERVVRQIAYPEGVQPWDARAGTPLALTRLLSATAATIRGSAPAASSSLPREFFRLHDLRVERTALPADGQSDTLHFGGAAGDMLARGRPVRGRWHSSQSTMPEHR